MDNFFFILYHNAQRVKITQYAKHALSMVEVKEELKSKGALGKYIWNALKYCSKEDFYV